LIFINFLNEWTEQSLPGIPVWVVPVFSSIFAVAVGIAVWKKVREADRIKYEFISTTMHKFRTPLTRIKLATDGLAESGLDNEQKRSLDFIEKSNEELIRLTDLVKEKAK
jgi:signal transduction histidine kinase